MTQVGDVFRMKGSGVGMRARGGPVQQGRAYVVGEDGPELLTMGGNGYVHPNVKTRAAMAGGGPTLVIQVMMQAGFVGSPTQLAQALNDVVQRARSGGYRVALVAQ